MIDLMERALDLWAEVMIPCVRPLGWSPTLLYSTFLFKPSLSPFDAANCKKPEPLLPSLGMLLYPPRILTR